MAEIAITVVALRADARADRCKVAFRGGGFLPVAKPLYSWLAFVALIGLWQAAITVGWLNPLFLPSPASILTALQKLIVSGALWQHLSASLGRIGLGWLVGTALGLVFGLTMGLVSAFRAVGIPLVSALYPIPKIALLPLLILWLGIGESPKVVTIAAGVFFPTVIAIYSGVDAVPRNLIRMAQSFNLPVAAIIRKIVLPSALPALLAGCRISIATALLLVVSAEMIGAQFGIGAFLLTAGNLMQSDDLMAGVAVLSMLGLGFGAVISAIERAFLGWR
jgi:ABC-type nitrate/sulfonate/bicarbonate transport system permease component